MEILRYAGFVEETSYAESPAPAAAFCVDETSASLDAATEAQIVYEGSLGRGSRVHRPGFYAVDGDIEYAFDARTIGWLLKWALGGYAFSGSGPYTHEIYGNDDVFLPSFACHLGKDKLDGSNFEHVFSGCVIDSLELSVEDGYTMAKAAIKAAKDSKGTILARSAVELLLPEEYPLVFHEVTVNRQNSDITAKVKGLTFEIGNSLSPESGRSLGSRFARRIPAGAREVKLSLNMYYEDLDTLALLWGADSGPSDDGTTEVPIVITFDAGDDGSMDITIPRFVLSQVPLQPSGKDEIEMGTEGVAITDAILLADEVTTVHSELLVTLENDQDEMTVGGS